MAKKIIIVTGLIAITAMLFIDVSGNKFRNRVSQDERRILSAASGTGQKTIDFRT